MTSGVTADSSAAGGNSAIMARSSTLVGSVPRSQAPAARTIGRVSPVAAPASSNNGASSVRGSRRSASQPPVQAP